jgi:hypothetical protein
MHVAASEYNTYCIVYLSNTVTWISGLVWLVVKRKRLCDFGVFLGILHAAGGLVFHAVALSVIEELQYYRTLEA